MPALNVHSPSHVLLVSQDTDLASWFRAAFNLRLMGRPTLVEVQEVGSIEAAERLLESGHSGPKFDLIAIDRRNSAIGDPDALLSKFCDSKKRNDAPLGLVFVKEGASAPSLPNVTEFAAIKGESASQMVVRWHAANENLVNTLRKGGDRTP